MGASQAGKLAVVALSASIFLAAVAPPASAGDEEALFGSRYHSISVTKDGEPHALVEGTKLRTQFMRTKHGDEVSWRSGCNFFGRRIIVRDDVIDTRGGASTEIGCPNDLQRQDEFFSHFFKQDPSWSAEGRRLTLATQRVVIELRRRAE